jgi:SET domain-containing protein
MENSNGHYIISERKYNEGELIKKLSGKVLDAPTRYSIEVGDNLHIIDEIGQYMNHSFEPNCLILGQEIIALNDIDTGEELTFNYNETETKIAYPFIDIDTGIKVE